MNLYGRNPVLERLRADPSSIRELYLRKRIDLSDIVKTAKAAGIKFGSVDEKFISSHYPGVNTQGVIAVVDDFRFTSVDKIYSDCLENRKVAVFVDGVTDPQNLGGIIRTLACLGGFSMVLPRHNSAGINETVLRVASGGENYVDIAIVTNIVSAVRKAKDKDIWVSGAHTAGATDIRKAVWKYPLAVVIGSEGSGIRPGLLKELDETVILPMKGAELSYNVGVACALFCYEIDQALNAEM